MSRVVSVPDLYLTDWVDLLSTKGRVSERERERERNKKFGMHVFFSLYGYARCANFITSSASPWTSLLVESKALSITLNPSGTPPGL